MRESQSRACFCRHLHAASLTPGNCTVTNRQLSIIWLHAWYHARVYSAPHLVGIYSMDRDSLNLMQKLHMYIDKFFLYVANLTMHLVWVMHGFVYSVTVQVSWSITTLNLCTVVTISVLANKAMKSLTIIICIYIYIYIYLYYSVNLKLPLHANWQLALCACHSDCICMYTKCLWELQYIS